MVYGLSRFNSVLALAAACLVAIPEQALGQTTSQPADFQFALIKYQGGDWNPRPDGLPRLAWEIRKRTSIDIDLSTAAVDPSQPAVFNYPLLVWQGDKGFPPLPQKAIDQLRRHLNMGGTMLVDVSSGVVNGPFHTSVKRDLKRMFPDNKLVRIPNDHVLYKSFYLLDRHGGRVPSRAYLNGIFIDGRLAVIVSTNDLAGAIARDEFGQWEYDVGAGGEAVREVTFRLGINLVMYALCLDYKDDQVHIPFILQRRR